MNLQPIKERVPSKFCVKCGAKMVYSPLPNDTEVYHESWGGPGGWWSPNGPAYDEKTGVQLLWERWECPIRQKHRFLFWTWEDSHCELRGKTVKASLTKKP